MLALPLILAQLAAPAPKAELTPYAKARELVARGGRVVIAVRPPVTMTRLPVRPGYTTLRCDDAPMSPGRYDCAMHDGRPSMTKVEDYAAPPQSAEGWYWHLTPPGTLFAPGGS